MSAILISVTASVIGAGILFLFGTFFWRQPRIRVMFDRGPATSGAVSASDKLLLRWESSIELYNESPFHAHAVAVEMSPVSTKLSLKQPRYTHIKSTEKLRLDLPMSKEFPRVEVNKTPNQFDVLLPEELCQFELRFCYKNAWGKTFFTLYRREDGQDICTYHRWKPQWRAA